MEFKIGDQVVHLSYGVGIIDQLEEKSFSGMETRLYYKIHLQNGTVWVPVDSDRPSTLRPLTSKSQISNFTKLLQNEPAILSPDHKERHQELVERLKPRSFERLCEVVRDLTARSWEKALNEADAASLRQAREALCQEWAAAKGVSLADANNELDALLLESKQLFTT